MCKYSPVMLAEPIQTCSPSTTRIFWCILIAIAFHRFNFNIRFEVDEKKKKKKKKFWAHLSIAYHFYFDTLFAFHVLTTG